jgi:MSHA biogenesis protein MshP
MNAPSGRRQSGFALVLALFLIVSLAAIGVYLLTISTAQVEAGVQDEQGARAYQAARTGIDWGAFQLLRNSGSGFASTCIGAGGASSQTLTLTGGLAGFFAVVACLKTGDELEGADAVRSYRITVTGCNQATCSGAVGPTYVERQLQLTLTRTN